MDFVHKVVMSDFRCLDDNDLKAVLELRNQDSIRVHMMQDGIISLDEHMAFCSALKRRRDRLSLCFKYDGEVFGVINLSYIKGDTCDLGYYFVKKPFKGCIKHCFKAMGGVAKSIGIRIFSLYVKKENTHGIDFAQNRLKADFIREDERFVYYELLVDTLILDNRQDTYAKDEEICSIAYVQYDSSIDS